MYDFVSAFQWVSSPAIEGGLSMDPADKGNWTGGEVGVGELRGSKYGISAASFPDVDIANLTVQDAATLAKPNYWDKVRGDEIPYPAALLMFDFGYNAGPLLAIKTMQRALDLTDDGVFGPKTLGAVKQAKLADLRQFNMQRILAYMRMPGYPTYGAGWRTRSAATLAEATRIWALSSPTS